MSNNKSFNILLTNKYLEDGIPAEESSEKGIMKFRLPENVVLPSHAQIKTNVVFSKALQPAPLILSIEEFNNSSWVGNKINGRRIRGLIGILNEDNTDKLQMDLEVDLNNTQPINIQELTLKIEDANGLLSDFNEPNVSTYYDLVAVNNWRRNDGTIFVATRLDETHFKLDATGITYILLFTSPTDGFVNGSSPAATFVLDPAVQPIQTDPNLSITTSQGTVNFTPFDGAGLTSPIPFQGVVNDFCINLKVKQDPQYQINNIMREQRELMKGLILNKQEINQ